MHKVFEDAEKKELDITYDMYPYTAAGIEFRSKLCHYGLIQEV